MGAERHENRIAENRRSLQRTADELEKHIEHLEKEIADAREQLATRREEANIVENAAGDWEHRERADEGPFGVLGGPTNPPDEGEGP